jgi:hypothetical protein
MEKETCYMIVQRVIKGIGMKSHEGSLLRWHHLQLVAEREPLLP